MPNIIMPGQVFCPLCDQPMKTRQVMANGKVLTIYFCQPCEIGCFDFDPAFNKWRDTDKEIPCGICGYHAVKWFIRYMDGFFKSFCPHCKATMRKDGDATLDAHGGLLLPEDFTPDEEKEEPVQVMIPFSKLKIGKDKANELRNKMRRQQQN